MRGICLGTLLLAAALSGNPADQAQLRQQADTLNNTELVREVHLIREFLESSHKEDQRMQVLLGQYRLQHDTVTEIADRLESVRDELAGVEAGIATEEARASQATSGSNAIPTTEDDIHAAPTSTTNDNQAVLQDLRERQARLLTKQSRLAAALATEQTKLQTLQSALDKIIGAL